MRKDVIVLSKKTKQANLEEHKEKSTKAVMGLIDYFKEQDPEKANKFCYWLDDYTKFLQYENEFSPKKLKRYKRGEIIKAHLGFNVGSEEGGLHYCAVVEKENNLSSPIITVVPLTSLKGNKNPNDMRKGELYIGNCLFKEMYNKSQQIFKKITEISDDINEYISNTIDNAKDISQERISSFRQQSDFYANQYSTTIKELRKLKSGSIALVGQITTISKIRIYDPKSKYDALANVRLPNEILDKIDYEMHNLFIGKK